MTFVDVLDTSTKRLLSDKMMFTETARSHGAVLRTLDRLKHFADYRVLLQNNDTIDVAVESGISDHLVLLEMMVTSQGNSTPISLPLPGYKADSIAVLYDERFYIIKSTMPALEHIREQFKDGEIEEAFEDSTLSADRIYHHGSITFGTIALNDIRTECYRRWTVPIFEVSR